jgi:capsid protein
MDTDTWVQGVKVDRFGAPIAFGVAKRNRWGGYRNARVISAKRMTLLGYFDRFDQYRGVSPMAPALTPFRDVNENIGYALAKAKISQLFGLVTKRDDPEAMGDVSGDGPGDYEIDFGDGPFSMEIDREDEVDILESNTPALSFQQFQQSVIALALKALDIPFSFYDESFTNFYGSRAGLIQYQKSCKSKRADLQDFLNDVTDWLIRLWVLDGSLQLPRGMRVADLHFNWLPDGVPWWKPTEEAKGQIMSVEAGFKSPQSVCAELGTDFYENVDQTQKAIEYAKARGVSLSYVLNGGGSNGGSDDKAKP